MRKTCVILLAALSQAVIAFAAMPANLNGDVGVNFADMAILAAHWLHEETPPATGDVNSDGIVDWKDLGILVDCWLETEPNQVWGQPPVAGNVNATATQWLMTQVPLAGTDDANPDPPAKLRYIITSLPAEGRLYDMGPGGREINSVPHTLVANGSSVAYYTTTTTPSPVTFGYKVNDYGTYPYGGESGEATVTLTKAAHVNDYLTFDGRGYLTVADNETLDGSTFAVSFWVRTDQPDAGILSKRVPGGSGMEVGLWAGVPVLRAFDPNGSGIAAAMYTTYGGQRIDDGQWHAVAVILQSDNVYFAVDGTMAAWLSLPTGYVTMNNAADLMIGTDGRRNLAGSIDRLCFWKNPAGAWYDIAQITLVARTATTYGYAPTPTLDWRFSEGVGSVVTDSRLGLTGTFSDPNHVTWYPQRRGRLRIVPRGGGL